MNRLLIVVNMQNDYIDGDAALPEAKALVPKVWKKLREYIDNDDPTDQIIYVRDTHREGYLNTDEGKHYPIKHCVRGTDGWQVVGDIDLPRNIHINKTAAGYPYWDINGLVEADINGVEQIELVGLYTDRDILANALIIKSIFPEIDVVVDRGCCIGSTQNLENMAVEIMKSCYITVKECE